MSKKSLASDLGSALSTLLSTRKKKPSMAPTVKKKAKKKKSSSSPGIFIGPGPPRRMFAPTSSGLAFAQSSTKHSPFVISGRSIGATIGGSGGASGVRLTNANSVQAVDAVNVFNLDLLGVNATSLNFYSFPSNVRNIAGSFLRYRFRKLLVRYVPGCTTNTPGSMCLASAAETVTSDTVIPMPGVAVIQNAVMSPVWSDCVLDALSEGGMRRDWLFVSPVSASSVASDALARQETPGSLAVACNIIPASGTLFYGTLFFEYEIEFDGLSLAANFFTSVPATIPELSASPPTTFTNVPSHLCGSCACASPSGFEVVDHHLRV
jgi:hypothetical protein